MAATIANLSIKAFLDTTGIFVGAKKAEKGIVGLAKGIGDKLGLTAALVNPTTAAVAALAATATYSAYQINQAFKEVDEIDKMAERFDATAESIQKFAVAARLGDTDFETLMKGIQKMQMTIGTGGMSLDKRLAQVADQIAAIDDPGQRAAKAVEIFGKSGLEMQNLLMKGGKSITEATKLIDDFGLGLTAVDTHQITRANDAWDKMAIVLDGLWQKIGAQLAPIVADTLEFMLDALKDIGIVLKSQGVTWERVGFLGRMAMNGLLMAGRATLGLLEAMAIGALKLEGAFYSAGAAVAALDGNLMRSGWFAGKAKETFDAATKLEENFLRNGSRLVSGLMLPGAGPGRRGGAGADFDAFGLDAGRVAGFEKGTTDELRAMMAINQGSRTDSPAKETAKHTKETAAAVRQLLQQWNKMTGLVLATPEF